MPMKMTQSNLKEITKAMEKKYKSTNRLPSHQKMELCLTEMENPQYSILQTLTYA